MGFDIVLDGKYVRTFLEIIESYIGGIVTRVVEPYTASIETYDERV